jgi:penicillin-binding protein 1A
MIEEQEESGWKQHFPTYSFAKRDIALEEYKTAAKSLETEERVFLNASSMAALAAAALGSLAVGSLKKLTDLFLGIVPAPLTLLVLLTLVCGFSWVGLRYFADRQKAIAYASRKIIILRRMLGLNYGTLQLVLPNWRVEGADEPYAVFLFPGWNTYVAYPYYVLAGISCVVLFFLLGTVKK